MTPHVLQELTNYPQFPATARELIGVAGLEAAALLITAWGGQEWPVPVRAGGVNPKGVIRYERLSSIVGEIAAEQIVARWAGCKLQIPNLKEVLNCRAHDLIIADFDGLIRLGYSSPEAVFELGIRYGVTGKTVENTLKRAAVLNLTPKPKP